MLSHLFSYPIILNNKLGVDSNTPGTLNDIISHKLNIHVMKFVIASYNLL